MMRRNSLLPAVLIALCTVTATAQDWAKAALAKSPRHGEYVTIDEPGGRKLQAFVVYPEIKDKAPVVVLIHEIFGESDWFKLMADELAGAGYIVIAPDLLSGHGPVAAPAPMAAMPGMADDHTHTAQSAPGAAFTAASPGGTSAFPPDQVTRAVMALDPAEVTADLDAAADYAKKLPAASTKLYVAGFCWGGGKSFLYATHRKDLSAAFVFYGTPPPAEAMKAITAPVYGFYAQNDARVTSTVEQAKADMKSAGKRYEPVVYDGAGHGFMRAGEAPDANAANSAARRRLSPHGGVAGWSELETFHRCTRGSPPPSPHLLHKVFINIDLGLYLHVAAYCKVLKAKGLSFQRTAKSSN